MLHIIDSSESADINPENVNIFAIKLTSQEVGEGYFHILFTILYALYIAFAMFHLSQNKFKLWIPCTAPEV